MATSGTTTFNMTVDEVIAESYEMLGVVPSALNGYDLKSGRRSLSLLLQEFSNRNVFAFVSEKDTMVTVDGTSQYTLDADTNDIRNATIVVNSNEIELTRYSYGEYARLPNKATEGRPTIYYLDRQRDNTLLTLWAKPDAVYTINFEKLRKIQDVGEYTNNLDIPVRVLPAIVSGLAYKLALKRPTLVEGKDGAYQRLNMLKAEAEQQFTLAVEDDLDRISTFLRPDFRGTR